MSDDGSGSGGGSDYGGGGGGGGSDYGGGGSDQESYHSNHDDSDRSSQKSRHSSKSGSGSEHGSGGGGGHGGHGGHGGDGHGGGHGGSHAGGGGHGGGGGGGFLPGMAGGALGGILASKLGGKNDNHSGGGGGGSGGGHGGGGGGMGRYLTQENIGKVGKMFGKMGLGGSKDKDKTKEGGSGGGQGQGQGQSYAAASGQGHGGQGPTGYGDGARYGGVPGGQGYDSGGRYEGGGAPQYAGGQGYGGSGEQNDHRGGGGGGGHYGGGQQGFGGGGQMQGQGQGQGYASGQSYDQGGRGYGQGGYPQSGQGQQGGQRDLYDNQSYGPPGGQGQGQGYGYDSMPPQGAPQGYYPSGAGYNPGQGHPQQSVQPPSEQFGGQNFHKADGREQQGDVKQYFEYSNCQGNRKALLIGINYFGQSGELAGCINDALNVKQFLCERFGYHTSDIVMLTEDSKDPRSIPTKANIIQAMGWLVAGAAKDDSLFFHYSGHGTQTDDLDGDEGDDDDEAICPLDYHESGLIVDDDSTHTMLVKPLPAGCRLTAIFDSCHSGTVMDLPYVYTTDGKIKEPNLLAESGDELMSAGMSLLTGNTAGAMSSLFGAAKGAYAMNSSHEKAKKTKTSPADVIMWSGCKDDQTSADTSEAGAATGAMSYAFIASLKKYPRQSYMQLLQTIREELKGKYSQKPQLSACHPIDVELEFVA